MASADSGEGSVSRIILTGPTGERSTQLQARETKLNTQVSKYRRIMEGNNAADGMGNNSSQFPAL